MTGYQRGRLSRVERAVIERENERAAVTDAEQIEWFEWFDLLARNEKILLRRMCQTAFAYSPEQKAAYPAMPIDDFVTCVRAVERLQENELCIVPDWLVYSALRYEWRTGISGPEDWAKVLGTEGALELFGHVKVNWPWSGEQSGLGERRCNEY